MKSGGHRKSYGHSRKDPGGTQINQTNVDHQEEWTKRQKAEVESKLASQPQRNCQYASKAPGDTGAWGSAVRVDPRNLSFQFVSTSQRLYGSSALITCLFLQTDQIDKNSDGARHTFGELPKPGIGGQNIFSLSVVRNQQAAIEWRLAGIIA
jgi:hypothetical protein